MDLPLKYKGLFLGLLISTIALFLPWYSDIDSFRTGVSYLGITGPASLIGISLLIVNLATALLILYPIRFKRDTDLPISRHAFEKWSGIVYLYAAFLLASVYFHSDFGVNIANKSIGIGFYVGVVGGVFSAFCGIFLAKQELAHLHPKYVGDLPVEDNLILKEQWAKQQEIESKMMERQHDGIEPEVEAEPEPTRTMDPIIDDIEPNYYQEEPVAVGASDDGDDDDSNDEGSFLYRSDL
jgi:hypothetical protein